MGTVVATLGVIATGILTWLASRSKIFSEARLSQAQIDANLRTTEINFIVTNLRADVTRLQAELKEVRDDYAQKEEVWEAEIKECQADRDMMRAELRRIKAQVGLNEKGDD